LRGIGGAVDHMQPLCPAIVCCETENCGRRRARHVGGTPHSRDSCCSILQTSQTLAMWCFLLLQSLSDTKLRICDMVEAENDG